MPQLAAIILCVIYDNGEKCRDARTFCMQDTLARAHSVKRTLGRYNHRKSDCLQN